MFPIVNSISTQSKKVLLEVQGYNLWEEQLLTGEQHSPLSESWRLTLSKDWSEQYLTIHNVVATDWMQERKKRTWGEDDLEVPEVQSKQKSSFPGSPSNLPLTRFKIPSNNGIGFRCRYWSPGQESCYLIVLPSHDAPCTNLTCCPVTHLAVL